MIPGWPPEPGAGPIAFRQVAAMPFPINVPFQVRADLSRLMDPQGPLLISDARFADYARIKLAHLDDSQRPLIRLSPEARASWLLEVLLAVLSHLSVSDPGVVAALPEASPSFDLCRAGLYLSFDQAAQPSAVRIGASHPAAAALADRLNRGPLVTGAWAAFSLGLQEDLALMGWGTSDTEGLAAGGLSALALSVVFPSGWDPGEKLGADLGAIHRPVADGRRLREASLNLSRAMIDKGPFERFVWTLSDDPSLARWPGARRSATVESLALEDIHLRCERQVTLGLPAQQASLFLIRVQMAPLIDVCAIPERRATLVAALRSMSEAVVEYKQLNHLRERVLAAWGEAR